MPPYTSESVTILEIESSEAIKNSTASLFIGSGISRDGNACDWKGLLKDLAKDIELDVDKEHDLISLAQYYENSKGRKKIHEVISKSYKDLCKPAENHKVLASLPIFSYWTTNYDKLIEKAFEQSNNSTMVLTDDVSLAQFTDGTDVIIRKLHGDVDCPNKCVITKYDYEKFDKNHKILLAQLVGEMCSKTFLFLGYSFSDIDINHILTNIRIHFDGKSPQRHFCIMKRDSDTYKETKQQHIIGSLIKYDIYTVLVNEYSEITDILKEIRHAVYAKNVYISGAYEDITEQKDDSSKYAHEISKWLISQGYKVYTGYGKNLGADVVAGGFEGCRNSSSGTTAKKFNENVFLFPFPYKHDMSEKERGAYYTELRRTTLRNTHITIVINGTKEDENNGTVINSSGCIGEAHLSIEQGNLVIPIAVTGGAAEVIWNEMKESKNKDFDSPDFEVLKNGAHFEDIISTIKKIITGSK